MLSASFISRAVLVTHHRLSKQKSKSGRDAERKAAVVRELGARSEVPKTMPQRIADLLRELHRRLRNPSDEAAPRVGLTEPATSDEGGVAPRGVAAGLTVELGTRPTLGRQRPH
jgi:hypothetical protein